MDLRFSLVQLVVTSVGRLGTTPPISKLNTTPPISTSTSKGWPKRNPQGHLAEAEEIGGTYSPDAQGVALGIRMQHLQVLEVPFDRSFCIHS